MFVSVPGCSVNSSSGIRKLLSRCVVVVVVMVDAAVGADSVAFSTFVVVMMGVVMLAVILGGLGLDLGLMGDVDDDDDTSWDSDADEDSNGLCLGDGGIFLGLHGIA